MKKAATAIGCLVIGTILLVCMTIGVLGVVKPRDAGVRRDRVIAAGAYEAK